MVCERQLRCNFQRFVRAEWQGDDSQMPVQKCHRTMARSLPWPGSEDYEYWWGSELWLPGKKERWDVCASLIKRWKMLNPLQWRHNEPDDVSNHQPQDYLLNRLFSRRSKESSKLRVTGRCEGNSPVNGEFPINAENVSIRWRHHVENAEATTVLTTLLARQIVNNREITCKSDGFIEGINAFWQTKQKYHTDRHGNINF